MIELLPGHLTKNALFLPQFVYFQRMYCIEYEKIEHREGSSMLRNENSSIEHARASKINFGRAFFGLEYARVQHYYITYYTTRYIDISLYTQIPEKKPEQVHKRVSI